jgi:hypothetical protein
MSLPKPEGPRQARPARSDQRGRRKCITCNVRRPSAVEEFLRVGAQA